MNHDGKHEQAALDQVRSDLRALIEVWEKSSPVPALWAMAGLFIGYASSDDTEGQIDSIDDYINALLEEMRRRIDEKVSIVVDVALEAILETSTVVEMSRVLDWLHALDMSTSGGRRRAAGVFDDALRFMVKRNEDLLGQFVTPEPVANLMLELADLKPGESVYDPCFGFGELLAGASRRLNATLIPSSPRSNVGPAAVSGVENKYIPYPVTLGRLLLAEVERPGLEFGDALKRSVPRDGSEAGFDCVVAAPPWGDESTYDEDDSHFRFPSDRVEELFLQHVMANVRPGGRAVVALPERPLFHADSLPLRKALLSEYRVQDVIALPAGSLEPFTGISMSIVVFSRDEPRDAVRFLTVSPIAWEAAQEDARGVAEMSEDHRQASASYASPGVESWSAPVRELALRDYELIAKKSGSERLDAEIERLVKADRSLKVKSLDEVAEVFHGVENDFFDTPEPNLLRSADVTDVRIRRPQTEPFDVRSLLDIPDPRAYLRGGDLLVPMTDNVGSTFLVEEDEHEHEYEVMADETIAFVRVHEGIVKPRFLAALLRSPAYWFWLSGHATGSTIRHLSIPVLRELKVPVPPVSVQDAVLKELGEPRGDALAVLFRLFSGMARHPVTLWLEGPLAASLAAGRQLNGARGMDTLAKLAAEIRSLATPPAAPTAGDGAIDRWLEAARRAAASLDYLDSVPEGAGRLVVLEFAVAKLREALGVLDRAEDPLGERLRSVTWGLVGLVEDEAHAMQRKGRLDITVPAEVLAGTIAEVRLRVTNPSPVPLSKVRVTARQADLTLVSQADRTLVREVPYMAEGQRHEIPLVVRAPDDTQSLHIEVAWQARRLDGIAVSGEKDLRVLVRSDTEAADLGDLGFNPYITGSNPEVRPKMFFGRECVMQQIKRQLGASDHANVILLEGNRRTGKTSILKMIEKVDAPDGWIPVYCSLQSMGVSAQDVFRVLAQETGYALHATGVETWLPEMPAPDPNRPFELAFRRSLYQAFAGDHPFETFQVYLSTAVEAVRPRRILYLLDEFDELQANIDAGRISPQLLKNIRHLIQHQPGICAIITGSRRLKKLREEYWSALFGLGYRIGISELPIDDARRLVIEPVAGKLRYLPQAADRLVELCACHPFLIQSLCSRVFDRAATGEDRIITTEVVEQAANEMVRDNEHFQTLWDYAGTERRRLLLMLCDRLAEGPDAINLDLIRVALQDNRVRVPGIEGLADDISALRELELISFDDSYRGGTYRLSIPLMAMWMKENKDFDETVARAREEAEYKR